MLHIFFALLLTTMACSAVVEPLTPKASDMVAITSADPSSQPANEAFEVAVYSEVARGTPMITLTTFEEADVKGILAALRDMDGKTAQIWLRITTSGGSVSNGLQLIQTLEALKSTVVCVVDFKAYSMGFDLLQSPGCDLRLATPRSTLMWHAPRMDSLKDHTGPELRDVADYLDASNNAFIYMTALRIGVNPEVLAKRIHRRDWWMSWQEAARWKFIDGIILPRDLPTLLWLPPVKP